MGSSLCDLLYWTTVPVYWTTVPVYWITGPGLPYHVVTPMRVIKAYSMLYFYLCMFMFKRMSSYYDAMELIFLVLERWSNISGMHIYHKQISQILLNTQNAVCKYCAHCSNLNIVPIVVT